MNYHKIGFIRSGFDNMAYGRLYRYLCRMLWRFDLLTFEYLTVDDIETMDQPMVVVVPWDQFANGGGMPVVANVKYILLVFEPLKNIEEWMEKRTKAFMTDNIIAYINLVKELDPWFRKTFPGVPLFSFHQGYVEYEDGKLLQTTEPNIEFDVIMPGHCYGSDRPQVVQQLRDCGLVVADQSLHGAEIDVNYPKAKVHAYYPYGAEYTAWHGQRTLWAINKGICCVGVESEDKESEQLYKGLYVACSREAFVATVQNMVRSGEWKSFGQAAYDRYRSSFDAAKLFDMSLVRYFRWILKRHEQIEQIPLFKVRMHADAVDMASKVLQSGYLTQGPKVEEFETMLAQYFGFPSSILLTTVNSATTGLTLALRLLRDADPARKWPGFDEEKDYVLTSPLTCTATNWAVLANRYKLQWVDTQTNSTNMDLKDLQSKLTKHSKIILFVHWGGIPVDVLQLKYMLDVFERQHGFRPVVIEDCAHAFGSQLDSLHIGTHGNVCVFSFQAIKHLTTSDGGLVIWPTEALAKKARVLRWFGIDRDAKPTGSDFRNRESTDIPEFGYKWHMNDLNASIGIGNLRNIREIIHNHTENHLWLRQKIEQIDPEAKLYENMWTPLNARVCGWIFTLFLPNAECRKRFMAFMTEHKIQTSQVHFRNDIHSCTFPNSVNSQILPNLERLSMRYVCIPCGWWLKKEDLDHIAWALDVFAGREVWHEMSCK